LRKAEQRRASNVMVNADLGAAQAAEILFRLMDAGTVKAIDFLSHGQRITPSSLHENS
jgi:hypothetical protein